MQPIVTNGHVVWCVSQSVMAALCKHSSVDQDPVCVGGSCLRLPHFLRWGTQSPALRGSGKILPVVKYENIACILCGLC